MHHIDKENAFGPVLDFTRDADVYTHQSSHQIEIAKSAFISQPVVKRQITGCIKRCLRPKKA